jgi:hypothetical protein
LVKRKTNSPWGSAYKEGLPSTAVNDRVEVDEILYPSVNTGNIDVKTGQWEGITLTDNNFTIDATHSSVANSASVLSPQDIPIDMTGYSDLLLAIRVSNAGNFKIGAVMGPDGLSFANLIPVVPAVLLKGFPIGDDPTDMSALMDDAAENLSVVDAWFIFSIMGRLKHQKLLQFKITNNSGDASDIQIAYLRAT